MIAVGTLATTVVFLESVSLAAMSNVKSFEESAPINLVVATISITVACVHAIAVEVVPFGSIAL